MGAPPRSGAATRFYRTVSTRVSVGEYWRLAPGPIVFAIMVLAKLARIEMPMGGGFPYVERLDVLSYRDLPQVVRDAWGEVLPACREQGLAIHLVYTVPVLGVDKESYGAAMLGDNGDIIAQALFAREGMTVNVVFACYSVMADGTTWVTTGRKKQMDNVPGFVTVRLPGQPPDVVLARHRERLRGAEDAIVRFDKTKLADFVVRMEQTVADHYIGRGLWAPMTDEEMVALQFGRHAADDEDDDD